MSRSSLPMDAVGWTVSEGGKGDEPIESAGTYRLKGSQDDPNC
ncbi:hypothetical protein [uncultured Nitrospira sp.]